MVWLRGSFFAVIIGFLLDCVIGDPYFVLHPIRIMGSIISFFDKKLRVFFAKFENQKIMISGGIVMVAVVLLICGGTGFFVIWICYKIDFYFGIVVESILCCFMFAAKSLKKESMKVYENLKNRNIEGARKAVSMIVGRDTDDIDENGIIKATVETVAENTSDGVIAPMFYMMLGGAFFGIVYKAVNTMDSMIGYKNDKYIYFGRAAAKTDDIFNFIPSRISAFAMIAASFILGFDFKNAFKIFKRDRFKHSSPNSAQTESVCAGALNIMLAGDAWYFGKLYKKEFIGDDNLPIQYKNIKDVNFIMYISAYISLFVFFAFRYFVAVYLFF